MLKKIAILLEMIKFEHTVFALPFALMGAFLGKRGIPAAATFGWVVLAMVGARTCAMGFNRIVDRKFDEKNPRTADRALPASAVKLWEAWLMVVLAGALFFFACYGAACIVFYPFLFLHKAFYLVVPRCPGHSPGIFTARRLGCRNRFAGRISPYAFTGRPFLGGGV
jgi:4-hydroxybenzoate polyprenyltransferase